MDAFLGTIETTSLIVIKSGKVAYAYGDVAQANYLASARKSVLSMLYGKYVANGTIRLEATLRELQMSDVGGLLPLEEQARVIDLITARSGVYHPAANPSFARGDALDFAPKRGSRKPGTYWLYSNWDFNAAGAAFERQTGKDIYDALRDDLASPIGMQDFDRQQQRKYLNPERSQYPAYPMWLSARDLARLGYLMLRNGRWRDRQLIPADWVRRSTAVVTPPGEMHPSMFWDRLGYGYFWWVWDGPFATGPYEGAYTANGAFGQWLSILPKLDMVVAHQASWSPAGGSRHSVRATDYFRLLDLLTEKQRASAAELHKWHEARTRKTEARKESLDVHGSIPAVPAESPMGSSGRTKGSSQ